MRPGRSCVCRFAAARAVLIELLFESAMRETEFQIDRPRFGRAGSCGTENRKIEKAVQNGGSAETRVRRSRYQNTRLIYAGFVGEGIRSTVLDNFKKSPIFVRAWKFLILTHGFKKSNFW